MSGADPNGSGPAAVRVSGADPERSHPAAVRVSGPDPDGSSPAAVRLEGVSVAFGGVMALEDVDLAVEAGDLAVLVGPSGSGKSTLLRCVNRLVDPVRGRVRVRGRDIAGMEPAALRRSIGYVIQSVGLFPHRTVAQNIATVPRILGWPKARVGERVAALLALVRLEPELAGRRPAELSGGQAQRVGLARALAADPDILLMDEPFGAVDPIVRRTLRTELRRIHAETGKTILLVTHDPVEALELATRLVVLREGRVVAAGRPVDLTDAAGDAFVRDLFGGDTMALHRLRFTPVSAVMEPGLVDAPAIAPDATLREALARMIALRVTRLSVAGAAGPVGSLALDALVERHR
ncbi:MAG TPA: ABC transporter ATP-binding protein [Microvirga sp.]|jgi:osmoprotectant transport system ATP-binding protein|nr:ABC transporter ATP-binding protein [Microvirga sp.]